MHAKMRTKEKLISTRRKFIQSAGLGLMACGLYLNKSTASVMNQTGFKVLKESDSVDIGDKGKDIIQKAMIWDIHLKRIMAAVHVAQLLRFRTPSTLSLRMMDYSERPAALTAVPHLQNWLTAVPLQVRVWQ